MPPMWNVVRSWVPFGIVATMLCGLVFVSLQHTERSTADDLPLQLAVDIGERLRHGVPAQSLIGAPINLRISIAPFAIVVNGSGHIVASSADIPGGRGSIPSEVIRIARENGEHRLTWQPADDIRIALVLVAAHDPSDSVVIAGHSLMPFERRIGDIRGFVLAFWFGTLLLTFGAVWWRKL